MWSMIRFEAEYLVWTCFLLSKKPSLMCRIRRIAALRCFLLRPLIILAWFLHLLEMVSVCLVVLVFHLRKIIFSVTTAVDLNTHERLVENNMGLLLVVGETVLVLKGIGRGNARAHLSDMIKPPSSVPVVTMAIDVFGLSTSEFEIALRHLLDYCASTTILLYTCHYLPPTPLSYSIHATIYHQHHYHMPLSYYMH